MHDDNVIPLPGQTGHQGGPTSAPSSATLDKVAPEGSALNQALRQILSADRSFEPQGFLQGARAAYEMIVTAFANGDRKTLKNLLSKEVYEGFVAAISDRESRGETIESTFVGIDKADIVEAALKGSTAQVTVKFRSELISATATATAPSSTAIPTRSAKSPTSGPSPAIPRRGIPTGVWWRPNRSSDLRAAGRMALVAGLAAALLAGTVATGPAQVRGKNPSCCLRP